jgi:hypothetical protein
VKRVFISFAMEDKKQVDGVRLLSWHQHIDLEFFDESVRTPYNSTDANYIRGRIKEKISRSSVTLVLLGTATYDSEWVDWEIRTSIELGNRIIPMGLPNGPTVLARRPPSIQDRKWFLWSIPNLQQLIESPNDLTGW